MRMRMGMDMVLYNSELIAKGKKQKAAKRRRKGKTQNAKVRRREAKGALPGVFI
jgi:hypothetical protein